MSDHRATAQKGAKDSSKVPRSIKPMPPPAQPTGQAQCISFLFAVSEFVFDPSVNIAPQRDTWGNYLPPGPEARAQWCTDLESRMVFRYKRWGASLEFQDVSQAVGYWLWRQDANSWGRIVQVDGGGSPVDYPEPYSVRSVCYSTKHMPILVAKTDASLGLAYTPRTCACELNHYPEAQGFQPWQALQFEHFGPQGAPGLSVLKADSVGRRYAVGHTPAWIPALVPEAFRDTFAPHESQGLTGDIATLVGLMALHSPRGTPEDVFQNQRWRNNRWMGPATAPRHVPRPQTETFPRGFLVHVCLDSLENPFLSTIETMTNLEKIYPIVVG